MIQYSITQTGDIGKSLIAGLLLATCLWVWVMQMPCVVAGRCEIVHTREDVRYTGMCDTVMRFNNGR